MTVLNRKFSLREKILFLILCLLLIGFGYYHFVDQPVRSAIAQADSEKETLQVELTAAQAKLAKLKSMQNELNAEAQSTGSMPSYNGVKAETTFLNGVMNQAVDYTLNFDDVTRKDDQIRRGLTVEFTAKSYDVAVDMLTQITSGEYRCIIGSVSVSSTTTDATTSGYYSGGKYIVTSGSDNGKEDDITSGAVSVTCNATFYETMVGGIADSGLPEEIENTQATESESY